VDDNAGGCGCATAGSTQVPLGDYIDGGVTTCVCPAEQECDPTSGGECVCTLPKVNGPNRNCVCPRDLSLKRRYKGNVCVKIGYPGHAPRRRLHL
jgi:hypothetical protein